MNGWPTSEVSYMVNPGGEGWQHHHQAAIAATEVIVAAGIRGVLHGFLRYNIANGVTIQDVAGAAATELGGADAALGEAWSGDLDVQFTDGLEITTTTNDEVVVYYSAADGT